MVDIPTQILLTMLLSIGHLFKVLIESSYNNSHHMSTTNWYFSQNLKGDGRVIKEWAKFELACLLLILIFIYSNSKVIATNTRSLCVSSHTKENPSEISDIIFAIECFLSEKNTERKTCVPEYSRPTLDEPWSDALQNGVYVYFNIKTQNLELVNLNSRTTHSSVLKPISTFGPA